MMEKLKGHLFDAKVSKDIAQTREMLFAKAKTYYSSEALNPRPKRGRPPKQVAKVEVEPQVVVDIYTTVPPLCRLFLYLPDIANASSVTFSAKFGTEAELLASLKGSSRVKIDPRLEVLSARLASLRSLSSRLSGLEDLVPKKEARLIKALDQENTSMDTPQPQLTAMFKGMLPGGKKRVKGEESQVPAVKRTKTVTDLTSPKKHRS